MLNSTFVKRMNGYGVCVIRQRPKAVCFLHDLGLCTELLCVLLSPPKIIILDQNVGAHACHYLGWESTHTSGNDRHQLLLINCPFYCFEFTVS